VPDYAVQANPQFKGKHAMEVMDAVIAALAQAHIMVILDNHMSAQTGVAATRMQRLWYNRDYPRGSGSRTGRGLRPLRGQHGWLERTCATSCAAAQRGRR